MPLALADILNLLVVVSKRAAGYTGEIKPLSRSEILKSWALPVMGAAIEEDEKEHEAFELLKSVKNLGKK